MTIVLGYRLFTLGVTGGKSVEAKTAWGRLVIGGTGPGLVFMTWGCSVMIYALIYGGAEVTKAGAQPVVPDRQVLKTVAVEVPRPVIKPEVHELLKSGPPPAIPK
jgi:hypothetical protein